MSSLIISALKLSFKKESLAKKASKKIEMKVNSISIFDYNVLVWTRLNNFDIL
ncbi:hypothetical protein IJG04_00935 [Candidatus Saccharibacteria bacterium]|nr:hypothetical protein [Candidatus Saccharibacteria bacterium]